MNNKLFYNEAKRIRFLIIAAMMINLHFLVMLVSIIGLALSIFLCNFPFGLASAVLVGVNAAMIFSLIEKIKEKKREKEGTHK